ncbi:MAG: DUF488 family protein [Limisphaerales bacterium]
MRELFTIGHSTLPWEQYLELLLQHRIEAIADVRSNPYSARFPQYNRRSLDRALRAASIRYVFLGDELGARRNERDCYVEGVARYDRIAQTSAFRAGLERVRNGVARFRLALMCAEKDPLECHRTILVCRQFRNDMDIRHILGNGSLEFHTDSETRLMAEENVPGNDLFAAREELIARAYERRSDKIAYHECVEPAMNT